MEKSEEKRSEFTQKTRLMAWRRSGGHCVSCGKKIRTGDGPEYDHRVSCKKGGTNDLSNCDVLCKHCHSLKTNGPDSKDHAKINREEKRAAKAQAKRPGFRGWRKFDGTIVWKQRAG